MVPPSEIVSPHGVFRGCFFYVQVCDRSPLDVQDNIRILKMCGGQVMHHPLSQKVTHYIVEAKTERPHYVHRIKGGSRPYPGEGKEFTLDDLVKVATSCQGQITVVQSAWIAECRDRGRPLGPTEDCGGWIVKAVRANPKVPPAEVHQTTAPTPRTSGSRLFGTKIAAATPSSARSLNPRTEVACQSASTQVASASTPSPVASTTSLLSPISQSMTSPLHSPDDTTFVPPWECRPSTAVHTKSTFSATPAFLKSSTRRNHAQTTSSTVKRIPNTAWVRHSTMGDFEVDVNHNKRGHKAPTRSGSVSSESTDVKVRADPPKRRRLDLSSMKFNKMSSQKESTASPMQPRSAAKSMASRAASDRRASMLPRRINRSRSSSPEEPLSGTRLPVKLGIRPNDSRPAQPSATFNPYSSPSLTLSPLDDASEDYPPCDDLFLGTDQHPIRFFLDDASHACFAGTILVGVQFASMKAN